MPQTDIDRLLEGPLEGVLKQFDARRINALENRAMLRIFLCTLGGIFIVIPGPSVFRFSCMPPCDCRARS